MLTTKLNAAGSTPWRVLITDAVSVKVLSSAVKMSDLADVGVSGRWRAASIRCERAAIARESERERVCVLTSVRAVA